MPQWIHDRARHIQAKNPGMAESTSFAIATQQAHATGKSPKSYGTTEGRKKAKKKYSTPGDDMKTADPGGIGKQAGLFRAIAPIATQDQDERFRQILREELKNHQPAQSQQPSLKTKTAGITHPFPFGFIEGFSDELEKMAQLTLGSVAPKPTVSSKITSSVPRNTMSAATPRYSQVNQAAQPGPMQMHQPVLNPPPVRG